MNILTKYKLQKSFFITVLMLCILITFKVAYAISVNQATNGNKNWNFKVYLDDKEIGFHNFSIVNKNQSRDIYSTARFNVKFLFINAYSYKHDNVENWQGECLNSINAITDDNGDLYHVSGEVFDKTFIVNTSENDNERQDKYLSCIKTFAYWDPAFLNESNLLNSQTGKIIKVTSEFIGNEAVKYKGNDVVAKRYRLLGKDLQIDLWYSSDNQWLALESLTESGRVVRYSIP